MFVFQPGPIYSTTVVPLGGQPSPVDPENLNPDMHPKLYPDTCPTRKKHLLEVPGPSSSSSQRTLAQAPGAYESSKYRFKEPSGDVGVSNQVALLA